MTRRSRQDNAGERRRRQHRPLEEWFRELAQIDHDVRQQLGLDENEQVPSSELILEVARLSDPWAVDGVDVVVPGNRHDLARHWMTARLRGRGRSDADWIALTREIAPPPDEHLIAVRPYADGRQRYRVDDKRQQAITEAAESYFRNERQRGETED